MQSTRGLLTATIVAAVLVLLNSSYLPAQSTWNGLRFGMNEAEVSDSLAGKAQKTDPKSQHTESRDSLEVRLTLSDFKVDNISMDVNFWFGKSSNRLEKISLMTPIDPFKAAPQKARMAIRDIEEELAGKYGSPVATSGECDADRAPNSSGILPSCNKVYRSGDQRITLGWVYAMGRVLYIGVRYEPQAKGL